VAVEDPHVDAQRVAHVIAHAERRITAALARVLEAGGATVGQWRILVRLADGESHAMSALADFALLAPPTLTRLIDRMVADNLLYRVADPGDRRRVLIRLTARGRSLHGRLAQRIHDERTAILGAAELAPLVELLGDGVERV
jgi:DNA-binding MarR family transcriptional regulator